MSPAFSSGVGVATAVPHPIKNDVTNVIPTPRSILMWFIFAFFPCLKTAA
jgi:hypothetical protein